MCDRNSKAVWKWSPLCIRSFGSLLSKRKCHSQLLPVGFPLCRPLSQPGDRWGRWGRGAASRAQVAAWHTVITVYMALQSHASGVMDEVALRGAPARGHAPTQLRGDMINECIPRACVVTARHSPVWPDTVWCPSFLGTMLSGVCKPGPFLSASYVRWTLLTSGLVWAKWEWCALLRTLPLWAAPLRPPRACPHPLHRVASAGKRLLSHGRAGSGAR